MVEGTFLEKTRAMYRECSACARMRTYEFIHVTGNDDDAERNLMARVCHGVRALV